MRPRPPAVRRSFAVAASLVLGTVALAACGGSDNAGPEVGGGWARTSPASATVGAVYFTVSVDDTDRLLSASVDSSIAASAELHEMVPASADGLDHGDMDEAMDEVMDEVMDEDMDHEAMHDDADHEAMHDAMDDELPMQMQQVMDGIEVSAGSPLVFEPGGYHLMLVDLVAPLEAGDTIAVTLTFETAGDIEIEVPVRDTAP